MNNFQFDYEGIIPLNYKGKQTINDDLDEILKNTINTTIDWKKRENALKKLGQICIGNEGNSDTFIKAFNGQLATHLGIQMADLRSSVMKEACRITSLCAQELGISIEPGATYLLTQFVLFKIAGSANRVISDSSSKCILNLVKYVNSIKVISNICEQKSMKSNFVRNICAQCILYIMTCYKKNLIMKTNDLLQDAMKSLLRDANGEVRATTRRAFITYRKRFEDEGDELFENLEKNTQKQIIEDEKNYGESIVVDSEDGGEISFENIPKNKACLLYGTSSKSRSHEVKYNYKDNIDKACCTYQKELENEELYDQENDIDNNAYSRHFSETTDYSENLLNDKSEDNINVKTNTKSNISKLKNKGNKSFKGKETINPNNCFSKTTKLNNKEILKKLNDKFKNCLESDDCTNNNYINTNENNNEPQKVVKQFNSSVGKKTKAKKLLNKSISNDNSQNSSDFNNSQNKINKVNNKQNNINNKQNNVNINNYIQKNNNINDNFNININKDSIEYKIIDKINQLSKYNNIKEKIKIFQYLFNSFTEILNDINNISDMTLRQFVDTHIEYITYDDKALTEQIIKNFMRMIFYLTQIFTSNDIKLIVKLLMMKINLGEKSVSKLSYELLDLIRKKWKIEDIYNGIFNLLEDNKKEYDDVCYEYLTLLVIYCGNIFEDINYFRKIMKIISNGDMNSKKIGKLIEALYKNNSNNFVQVLKELDYEDQQKILYFFDNKNGGITKETKQNQVETTKNNNNNNNSSGKIKKIINPKSNTNTNANTNTNNNNNEINELKKYIENGNVKSFLDYLGKNKEYFVKFLMLLSDEKYTNPKYVKNILNLIYSLISLSNNFQDELSQYLEILIDYLIAFFIANINNSFIVDMVKEILNIMPNKINNEKYYKSLSKYLNNNTNEILLQTLLICIKNCIVNDKSKNLEKQLPLFIKGIFNLLEHQSSDVRKYAIYCCVEIYMILGHKFDAYLELLPKSQQNIINLFIKKKNS